MICSVLHKTKIKKQERGDFLRVWTFSDSSPKTKERRVVIKIALRVLLLPTVTWN